MNMIRQLKVLSFGKANGPPSALAASLLGVKCLSPISRDSISGREVSINMRRGTVFRNDRKHYFDCSEMQIQGRVEPFTIALVQNDCPKV